MADPYRINILDAALRELKDIFDYVCQDSPQNAAKLITRILDAIDRLDFMPTRFKVVARSRTTGSAIHSMVVRPFIVYYRVQEPVHMVFILSIRHGAQMQSRHFE